MKECTPSTILHAYVDGILPEILIRRLDAHIPECSICRDLRRDPALVCVVERPQDIVVVERTQEFRGRYHVLGGAISPIEGVGPDQLRMRELVGRVEGEGIKEVIVATNPTVEGDTTALYLARLLKPLDLRSTA